MISTSSYINKLDALRKYMDVKVEHVARRVEWVNKTKSMFYNPAIYFRPFPNFEDWYELYLTTNN